MTLHFECRPLQLPKQGVELPKTTNKRKSAHVRRERLQINEDSMRILVTTQSNVPQFPIVSHQQK
jgi:hypothetical protein